MPSQRMAGAAVPTEVGAIQNTPPADRSVRGAEREVAAQCCVREDEAHVRKVVFPQGARAPRLSGNASADPTVHQTRSPASAERVVARSLKIAKGRASPPHGAHLGPAGIAPPTGQNFDLGRQHPGTCPRLGATPDRTRDRRYRAPARDARDQVNESRAARTSRARPCDEAGAALPTRWRCRGGSHSIGTTCGRPAVRHGSRAQIWSASVDLARAGAGPGRQRQCAGRAAPQVRGPPTSAMASGVDDIGVSFAPVIRATSVGHRHVAGFHHVVSSPCQPL